MAGKGSLILTGQLGDVMKESAQAALSFARAQALELGLGSEFYAGREIHIHVPAGGVPKDGPSAGVTMACALVSLISGIPVRHDVAMTGELTLRGKVLPIGGLKEKLLAAARAGITTVDHPGGEHARAGRDPGLRDAPSSPSAPCARCAKCWRWRWSAPVGQEGGRAGRQGRGRTRRRAAEGLVAPRNGLSQRRSELASAQDARRVSVTSGGGRRRCPGGSGGRG